MNILGLDPAASCGFAHSSGPHGVWQIAANDKHPGRRLERLRRHLFIAKREWGIDVLASEDATYGASKMFKGKQNLHTMAMHNELRGVIKCVAAEWDIPVLLFTPPAIKKWLTGHGRAKKPQMIRWVEVRFGIKTENDNVADAIAVMEFAKNMIARKAG